VSSGLSGLRSSGLIKGREGRPPRQEKDMTDHIPTIEELLGLPKREVDAIFRSAAAVASDATKAPKTKTAAAKTIENIRRCHPRSHAP
jgi:hypothetical protein